ncbi:hypothetical protein Vqi01_46510 [Micromonospora qiuiae]|uniref:Plasmid mobilization relaxosome protein MobC n=1 Tax=Micromonospora qiuiae TaxID=502268 RepID=A0ABQ4JJ50_9ACTN|nr:DUF1778 domain-containing protein [Micromonospora qiuiae]GIJ29489.1 hypothetical protein Vqi01_46510 [Micromonospora qiuiae]
MNSQTRSTRPGAPSLRGVDRRHQFPGRQHRINLRLDDTEHRDIVTAAARTGLTPTGFCANAALAAARGTTAPGSLITGTGVTRAELAAVQRELFAARTAVVRTGTNLNQATAALNATGETPVWLDHAVKRCERAIDRLDAVVAEIHQRLR